MLDGKPLTYDETMQFLKDFASGKREKEREEAIRKEQAEKDKIKASNKAINLSTVK